MGHVFTFPVFANAAFTGSVLGPVMGGFIAQSNALSWRWTEWTMLIMSRLVLGLVVIPTQDIPAYSAEMEGRTSARRYWRQAVRW